MRPPRALLESIGADSPSTEPLPAAGTTALPAGTIGANGSSPSYSILVAIVGALQQANMPFGSPGWVFAGRTLQSLMSLTNTVGEPLLASAGLLTVDRAGSSGTPLGYPFRTTNAIPVNQTYGTATNASTVIFSSDWSELFVGDWHKLAIDASQEASYTPDGGTTWISAYQSQQTVFRRPCGLTWRSGARRRSSLLAGSCRSGLTWTNPGLLRHLG